MSLALTTTALPWAATYHTEFPLILAPMAAVTHGAFRRLVEETAPFPLYFSEMISAGALTSHGRFESYYLDTFPGPDRLVFQIVGSTDPAMGAAATRLRELHPAGIDINFGCSAPEIVRNGGGIAWLSHRGVALRMLDAVRAAVGSTPLSVKLRLPEDYRPEVYCRFLSDLADCGVDALTIHPRYRKQPYARPARMEILRFLAEQSPLPVVASGDVRDVATLNRVREMPGVAGAMVGRAAIERPWIARELSEKSFQDAVSPHYVAERFFNLLEMHQPSEFLLSRSRRFVGYYLSRFPFGRRLAARLQQEAEYQRIRRETLSFLRRREGA